MGRWFGYKGCPTCGLFVMLITVTIMRITCAQGIVLESDVQNNASATSNGWTTGTRNLGERCITSLQCSDHNSICTGNDKDRTENVCSCKTGFQAIQKNNFSYCALITGSTTGTRKLGERCITSLECSDHNSICTSNDDKDRTQKVCSCKTGFEEIQKSKFSYCAFITAKQNKSQEIYKAAMVALACFILVILGIFLMFVLNRSIQSRRRNILEREGSNNSSREDIFSVCDQLARDRVADKPPTYEDVALTDHKILGMPPPSYSANEEESPFSNAAIAARLFPSSSESNVSGLSPSSNATSATRLFPSSNGTIATGYHNEAFASDA